MKAINPKGPNKGSFRVHRGGCWNYHADFLVASNRNFSRLDARDYYHSFRIVCNGRKE